MIRNCCVFLCLLALLLGCASRRDQVSNIPLKETFETEITDAGLKIFQYQLRVQPKEPAPGEPQFFKKTDTRISARNRGKRYLKTMQKRLTAGVTRKLKETNFCRKGYFVLGGHVGFPDTYIRGECKETATPQDRVDFG